jgi:superfamily II DNA or RNA helicase
MQTSSRCVLSMIPGGTEPPAGTGPQGLGGGRRWKTVDDVIAHNSLYNATGQRATAFAPEQALPLGRVPPPVALRDYQQEAVDAVAHRIGHGGVLEIGCGLGKTFVGGDIVRRRRQKAVIVCQHNVGVRQTVDHLVAAGFANVATAQTHYRLGAPLPDVTVVTYHNVVRTATQLSRHAEALAANAQTETHPVAMVQDRSLLLYLLHVVPIGTLILDEVHVAVADNFRFACCIRHNIVVGMSGSLIREDTRLVRLARYVGGTIFRHFVERRIDYYVFRVPLDDETVALLGSGDHRSKIDQAIRACHPNKLAALRHVLDMPAFDGCKFIVFCDSPSACGEVAKWLDRSRRESCLLITGKASSEVRDGLLKRFATDDAVRCILSTRVCDAGVDLPDGTVVVQLYQSCGSRQQEIQRAGRGARRVATRCTMVHIVNRGTEEEDFMQKRVRFMREQQENTVQSVDLTGDIDFPRFAEDDRIRAPLRAVGSVRISLRQNARGGRRTIRKDGRPRGRA